MYDNREQRILSSSPAPMTPHHLQPPVQAQDSNHWTGTYSGTDRFGHRTSLRFDEAPHHSGHPQREFTGALDYRERRSAYTRHDPSVRPPSRHSHNRQRSNNETSTDGDVWHLRSTSEDSQHQPRVQGGRRRRTGHSKQPTTDSDVVTKPHVRPHIKIPVPQVDAPYSHDGPSSNRYNHPLSSMDESMPYEDRRRSHDTFMSNLQSQTSRSRPRSGATAAAIGRLDSVLARGEDLLRGMRTSFALDPEEVHRSARDNHLRSAVNNEPLPMSRTLPYWPSKSRFYLELSIPAAYLTSHGLLKGSRKSSTSSKKEKRREDHKVVPALSPMSPPHRHGMQGSSSTGQHYTPFQQRAQRSQWSTDTVQPSEFRPSHDPKDTTPASPPRQLRRSRGPIQFESLSPRLAGSRTDPERERKVSTSAAASVGAAYQSFLPDESHRNSDFVRHQDRDHGNHRTRTMSGASGVFNEQHLPHLPRKSKSYPPQATPPSQRRSSRRRRLSSHDRLQIRMNPKAGDILNYVPHLFPSRSMSALVVPDYKATSCSGSSTSSSAPTTDAEDSQTARGNRHRHPYAHQRQSTGYSNRPLGSTFEDNRPMMAKGEKAYGRKAPSAFTKKHRQEFNFKTKCPFHLTPETMAACMIENISVEVWKLNSKRQTMIELGTAKLPLHKVLSQIMHKTAAYPSEVHNPTSHGQQYPHPRQERPSGHQPGRSWTGGSQMRSEFGAGGPSQLRDTAPKPVWRLEPNVYDIRSRHGTIIGQLDADIWVHPRSRSSSMTRNIHDNGVKHKENVERFLREQNQRSRDKVTEKAKMDKEMEAIEKAAMEQYQRDVDAGLVAGTASTPSIKSTSVPPPPTLPSAASVPAAAEMTKEKAQEKAQEKERSSESNSTELHKDEDPAIPTTNIPPEPTPKDETIGQPGAWQTVEVKPQTKHRSNNTNKAKDGESTGGSQALAGAVDDEDDGEHDPEDLRGFKVVEKTFPTDLQSNSDDEPSAGTDGSPMFKKRKTGVGKPRNIRRKV
ncbi:hypothetical protein BGZ94_000516 [Podila epigama]|nr:hypothetical protein BGZ94_000516 [Podila epigama]